MLVLTRRIGEEIVIASNIRVALLSIKGRQARLGITAPLAVPVRRTELLARAPLPRQLPEESGAGGKAGS
jgi:carbon storage regulator